MLRQHILDYCSNFQQRYSLAGMVHVHRDRHTAEIAARRANRATRAGMRDSHKTAMPTFGVAARCERYGTDPQIATE